MKVSRALRTLMAIMGGAIGITVLLISCTISPTSDIPTPTPTATSEYSPIPTPTSEISPIPTPTFPPISLPYLADYERPYFVVWPETSKGISTTCTYLATINVELRVPETGEVIAFQTVETNIVSSDKPGTGQVASGTWYWTDYDLGNYLVANEYVKWLWVATEGCSAWCNDNDGGDNYSCQTVVGIASDGEPVDGYYFWGQISKFGTIYLPLLYKYNPY